MWSDLFSNPILWITLTIGLYILGSQLKSKWPSNPLFTPIVFAMVLLIIFLMVLNIPLETYQKGGDYISLFITPATVSLAISLEKNYDYLRRYLPTILIGILSGVLFHTILIMLLALAFKLNQEMVVTMLPKSITTAIAMGVSESLGGLVSLTVGLVVVTGVLGAMMGPTILKLTGIEDPVAQGIALGSASHAIGTSRAIEMGEVQGAMGGVAIVVTGITVVVLAPLAVVVASWLF